MDTLKQLQEYGDQKDRINALKVVEYVSSSCPFDLGNQITTKMREGWILEGTVALGSQNAFEQGAPVTVPLFVQAIKRGF